MEGSKLTRTAIRLRQDCGATNRRNRCGDAQRENSRIDFGVGFLTFDSMSTVVLEDGKICIPEEVRAALGLGPGTVLEVQSQAGTLVAWKKVEPDVFEKWRGRGQVPAGADADNYLRLIRDGDSR